MCYSAHGLEAPRLLGNSNCVFKRFVPRGFFFGIHDGGTDGGGVYACVASFV